MEMNSGDDENRASSVKVMVKVKVKVKANNAIEVWYNS